MLDLKDFEEGDLVDLLNQRRIVILGVAYMEHHSQNIGTITLVEIPIISDTDFKFFDLYLLVYVLNVCDKIWAEHQSLNNFIKKMLNGGNYVTIVV